MDFTKFLNFDEYVTPIVIKIVYAAGTLFYIGFTIYNIPWNYLSYLRFQDIGLGLLIWLLGLLAIRLYCELMMVIFKALEKVASRK